MSMPQQKYTTLLENKLILQCFFMHISKVKDNKIVLISLILTKYVTNLTKKVMLTQIGVEFVTIGKNVQEELPTQPLTLWPLGRNAQFLSFGV